MIAECKKFLQKWKKGIANVRTCSFRFWQTFGSSEVLLPRHLGP